MVTTFVLAAVLLAVMSQVDTSPPAIKLILPAMPDEVPEL